jgi:hypothetical protein
LGDSLHDIFFFNLDGNGGSLFFSLILMAMLVPFVMQAMSMSREFSEYWQEQEKIRRARRAKG